MVCWKFVPGKIYMASTVGNPIGDSEGPRGVRNIAFDWLIDGLIDWIELIWFEFIWFDSILSDFAFSWIIWLVDSNHDQWSIMFCFVGFEHKGAWWSILKGSCCWSCSAEANREDQENFLVEWDTAGDTQETQKTNVARGTKNAKLQTTNNELCKSRFSFHTGWNFRTLPIHIINGTGPYPYHSHTTPIRIPKNTKII